VDIVHEDALTVAELPRHERVLASQALQKLGEYLRAKGLSAVDHMRQSGDLTIENGAIFVDDLKVCVPCVPCAVARRH
jgi:hypothetical protein